MASTAGYNFPDPIINRIQTFLNSKQAAQTTLVSKSWLRSWSTRRTIDLNESNFPTIDSWSRFPQDDSPCPEVHGLSVFAKKTFRRYKHHNLRIDTFVLSLKTEWYCRSGLATKWTYKALKLGATDFTFRLKHRDIVLPIQAVLESENLVRRLCLEQARIDRLKVVKCMGLKSLVLSGIDLTSGDSFHDMLSCCPLIENLSLRYVGTTEPQDDKQRAGSMSQLLNLTSLNLSGNSSHFRKLFRDNCWLSKFPNLKDLTLILSLPEVGDREILSSGSLEVLNLTVDGNSGAELEIHVPRIRKFTFEGSVMPNKFSFRSESRDELESRVSVTNEDKLSAAWFVKLSEFLTSMAGSRILLSLHLNSEYSFDYQAGDIECLNACELEDLTMDTWFLPTLSFCAVLDVVFRICRPKMITQYLSPPGTLHSEYSNRSGNHGYRDIISYEWYPNTRKNEVILCRALEQGMKDKGSLLPSQYMYGLRDLEELNAQKLCNRVWMSQPFDLVLDSASDENSRFRFQLKWKSSIVDYNLCL